MASVKNPFDTYMIFHLTRRDPAVNIVCSQVSPERKSAGRIQFYEDAGAVPDNKLDSGAIWLYFPLSRFDEVMTTLRQEKPLALCLDSDSLAGWIASGEEPVGEQEL